MKYTISSINTFLFFKLPSVWWSGIRVREISKESCSANVRLGWFNKNPFKSLFWAVQGMAAELTTGMLLTKSIQDAKANISMLLVSNKSSFHKKAVGKITFTCNEGETAKQLINSTIKNVTSKAWFKAKGYDEQGDLVSEFDFEWSCKKRKNG